MEQLANFQAATTLNMPGDMDAVTTTIIVASLTGFPTAYPYRIRIGNELLKVTALPSALHLTVVRADGGTIAAIHLNNSAVTVVLTKEALDSIVTIQAAGTEVGSRRIINFLGGTIVDDAANSRVNVSAGGSQVTQDVVANRPAVGNSGNIFIPTDSSGLEVDNGTIWVPHGPIFQFTKPPIASTWTKVNYGGSDTLTDSHNSVFMYVVAGSGDHFRLNVKSRPTPPYTITAGFLSVGSGGNYYRIGMALRDSGSTKMIGYGPTGDNGLWSSVTWMSSPDSYNSTPFLQILEIFSPMVWLRIKDDNTNFTYSMSADGLNFVQQYQESRTGFLPSGGDQVGWCVDIAPGCNFGLTLVSWLEGP